MTEFIYDRFPKYVVELAETRFPLRVAVRGADKANTAYSWVIQQYGKHACLVMVRAGHWEFRNNEGKWACLYENGLGLFFFHEAMLAETTEFKLRFG